MLTPNLEEFKQQTAQGRLVPLRQRIPADLETPVSAFLKLRTNAASNRAAPCFLLESVEQGIQVGRYSFIGVAPQSTIELRDETVHISRSGRTETHPREGRDPLSFIREEIERIPEIHAWDLPAPFAGAVGYLSYDVARYFEKLPQPPEPGLGLPDYFFMIPQTLVVFDHVRCEIEIIALPPQDADDDESAYAAAQSEIQELLDALTTPLTLPDEMRGEAPASSDADLKSNMSREQYEGLVRDAKEHILSGDAFQIVLSQRLGAETHTPPFQIYRSLRILNPSPYMFFFDFGDFQLVGGSPEVLVKVEKGIATLSPIAGTRPRGKTPAEDIQLADELLADEKERAEHVMLVDLGRNDLGRVCETGTVVTDSLMHIEKYSHVMHIVSNITGKLREDCDMFDLLRASFPAGTVSGAPKIRAMEIITDFERERRGPYAGAVGYLGHGGDMDMCITIRTIIMIGNRYYVQAGAGIVADSDPASEFEETLNKIRALTKAVSIAEKGF